MENVKKLFFTSILIILFFSCTQQEDQTRSTINVPKIVEIKGHIMPADSLASPKVISFGTPTIVKVGIPKIILTNTNIHISGKQKNVLAGLPKALSPGKDIFSLPKTIVVIDSPFVAGIPEVVITKDASTKDQNPQNFSSFGKLQGLKHGNINCMLQDKIGNLWLGTAGGGLSKYDGKSFTHYTEKEGLINNSVLSIMEDMKGNIWCSTRGGLSKYDGKSFTNFNEKDGLNNIVVSMKEDNTGNIWFGINSGGICKYETRKTTIGGLNKVVSNFTFYTEKEGLPNLSVSSITKDKNGSLWFGTEGEGVIKYDGKNFYRYTKKEGLCDNEVKSVLADRNGNLWFCTADGISKFDGKFFTSFGVNEGLGSNYVSSILQDKNGNLWLGTFGGGLNKFDGKSFTQFTEADGLYNNIVFSMLEDKSGNLWFGTYGGGLSKYDGKSFTHFTDKEGLTNSAVFAICEEKNGNIWFGTNGGGVSKYDGKSFTNFTSREGLGGNSVWSMLKDKKGNFWFGSSGGGITKYDGKTFTNYTYKGGVSNNNIRCILEDKIGNIWFGAEGGGICKYDGNRVEAIERGDKIAMQTQKDLIRKNGKLVKSFTNYSVKEGLSNDFVFSLLEDKNGNLWVGTYGGGANKFDGKTFTHFTEKEGLCNNFIFSMLEDKNGNIWFGSSGGGVDKYDGKYLTHFTEKEGLSNNAVLSILEDRKGNLWFGTRFGLSKLTNDYMARIFKVHAKENNEQPILFRNFTYQDGFLGIGCNANALYEDNKGTIWIGANDRLTAFHPEGEEQDTIPPNIQLTNLGLFNENIAWINFEKKKDTSITLGNGVKVAGFEFDSIGKWYSIPENLSLAYNNNYLTFSFIGVTQKQSKKVKYQYKLEGVDENWSALTSRTEAPYGNLPNGCYTFKVKAMNGEGYWSKEFNYNFTIRPPWSKTWWFRTLFAIFIIITLYGLYRWRTASLREGKKQLEKTVKERTAEVVQQKDEAEKQRNLVEKKQKEILDSITYAKRIQEAILPSNSSVKKLFPNSFILYKPKDIVAGDFYWIEGIMAKNENNLFSDESAIGKLYAIIFAAADCTGHGVPGAMVSVVCNNALNRALREFELREPAKILNKTRELVIEQFEKSNDEVKDGMDISLCFLNTKNNQLQWAGANNPLWIIRNGVLTEYKPNKQPIGKYPVLKPFTNHIIPLQKGDNIYIFTDGYLDQFGGIKGKKFKALKMRKLLLTIQDKNMDEQLTFINNVFEEWKGNKEQVDDVCVIGVKY